MKKIIIIGGLVLITAVGTRGFAMDDFDTGGRHARLLHSLELLGVEATIKEAIDSLTAGELKAQYESKKEEMKKWSDGQFVDFKIKNLQRLKCDTTQWSLISKKLVEKQPLTDGENTMLKQCKTDLSQQLESACDIVTRALQGDFE